ncbi:MAG: peptidase M16 protein [uncultured bacterium]|uniref:Peptidase M16 domain protein n=2 Tax=Candidatus Wolfeibacteriota TaxID=1752735 RepID=A0A0G1JI96_9BACT|nr:MAG: peptidase M16 protein [uncultured bacterium]KKR12776.1 MAG: Peptidase M16 domain protein [Candidatus Wolfebacteria bacterium GW2011_GWC2_39_22]KKT43707.1 MAG: Peptidase M16 domain protein [Candidatus Wolfebacteria bacterium GW2011_GWE2_44_13]HBI25562.1 hypothetical protein [Candidatus Wolfebacteria bacterium]
MWDPYSEFQSAILPNGLTVHAAYWPGRPWESIGFLVHSGAEHDPIGLEGLAHFVEHLVSDNANVPNKEIHAFFEDCGGRVNLGITDYPDTRYNFFVPTGKAVLARAFSVFGHMLFSAKFEKCIERERQVVLEEFNRRYTNNLKFDLDTRERKALYTDCWLGRFVRPLGNPESVKRITQADLQSYYNTHYVPANMSIVAVGGMQLSELVELLSESPFAMSKNGARTSLPIPVTNISLPLEACYVVEASKYVSIPINVGSYRSVAKVPGNINGQALYILKKMLDEILNEEVRERRAWAYAIDSSRRSFRHFYEFSINCSALALKAIDNLEKVVETCIATAGSSEGLFAQIKRQSLANHFMIDPTGRGVCDGALDDLTHAHRIISLSENAHDLECVTMDDVRDALQWLRPEQRWTLITKP